MQFYEQLRRDFYWDAIDKCLRFTDTYRGYTIRLGKSIPGRSRAGIRLGESKIKPLDGPKGSRYWRCKYAGKMWLVHRLIYTWHFGEIPAGYYVDHIDGDIYNNDSGNLRLLSPAESALNVSKQRDGQFLFKGVTYDGNWGAQLVVNGRRLSARQVNDEYDAATAYNFLIPEEVRHLVRPNTVPQPWLEELWAGN